MVDMKEAVIGGYRTCHRNWYVDPMGLNPVVAGEVAAEVGVGIGEGLFWWCRMNPVACMRTVGPAAIRVYKACKAVGDALGGDDDSCQAGWWYEYDVYCYRTFKSNRGALGRCRDRANDRLRACKNNGGRWPPSGPDRWSWQDEFRFRP
jgi:hypothetical protein